MTRKLVRHNQCPFLFQILFLPHSIYSRFVQSKTETKHLFPVFFVIGRSFSSSDMIWCKAWEFAWHRQCIDLLNFESADYRMFLTTISHIDRKLRIQFRSLAQNHALRIWQSIPRKFQVFKDIFIICRFTQLFIPYVISFRTTYQPSIR